MARFYFPTTSDGKPIQDTVGSEHDAPEAAIREGQTYAREIALERLRMGAINFEEIVEIRDEAGTLLGTRTIRVSGSDS